MDASQLESVPLFAELSRRDLQAVARHADEVDLPSGAKIVEQGRLAYELFVIQSGTANVLIDGSVISQLGPGDVVGEIGVLQTHMRTATVVATSPVTAIVMYGPELTALTKTMPSVFAELQRLIVERTGSSD
jgi:CRP/FNR family transcriptional regulator, cyclic AMP receptor protein